MSEQSKYQRLTIFHDDETVERLAAENTDEPNNFNRVLIINERVLKVRTWLNSLGIGEYPLRCLLRTTRQEIVYIVDSDQDLEILLQDGSEKIKIDPVT